MTGTLPAVRDRTLGLGGSDAAAILGLSPWRSNVDVFEETTGLKQPMADGDMPERVMWGNILEGPVADEFARRRGLNLRRVNRTLRHKDHPFLTAHIDRKVAKESALLEVKTTGALRADDWGPDGSDEIPQHYLVQILHYLAVTGYERAYAAVLIGGQELRGYRIERDDSLIQAIVSREVAFWNEHIVPKDPPAPINCAEAARLWAPKLGKTVEATPEIVEAAETLAQVKATIKVLGEKEEQLKLRIQTEMQDADTLLDPYGKPLVTWKGQTRNTLDTKAIKAELPDVAERFTRQITSRTFLLKVKGDA